MRFSIFEHDGNLGRSPSDPPQLPPVDGDCSCVHGTAYRDESGNCLCTSEVAGPLGNYGGPRTRVEHVYQTTVIPGPPAPYTGSKSSDSVSDGTIFGLSPLMLLVIAGGGLWLFSSMSGTTKKKGGEF